VICPVSCAKQGVKCTNAKPPPPPPPSVDCVGSYSAWTTCTKVCGTQTATFKITRAASGGGADCAAANGATKSQGCRSTKACPVDCVGAYGAFGSCSKTCGTGASLSAFKVTTAAKYGGTACAVADKATKSRSCNTQSCPCDGSPCKNGGKCTDNGGKASCACTAGRGGATCTSTVACPSNAAGSPCKCKAGYKSNGGASIVWDSSKQVYTSKCVVDDPCQVGTDDCDSAAVCSRTGSGTYTCACKSGHWTPSFYGVGRKCNKWKACASGYKQTAPPSTTADRVCSKIVNCVGRYGAWGTCSKSCGAGTMTAIFQVTTTATNGGKACTKASGATKSRACTVKGCPIHCVGSYGAFGSCSKTCGAGKMTAAYKITTTAANGGRRCSSANGDTKSKACSTPCPVDCVGSYTASKWGDGPGDLWGACSTTCGAGLQTSGTYKVTTAAAHGGKACAAAHGSTKSKACTVKACPPVVVPFASVVQVPKEVLVAGSKSRIAFETAFVKSVVASAKAALKVDVAASAVKITSVTGGSRRRVLAVSVKVAYTVSMPPAAAAAALSNKAAVQSAVAATATSAVAADASIKTAVAADKKNARAKVSSAAVSSARASGLAAALALMAAATLAITAF